jgi:2-polyprenyl-3-methyl-5-hydroxy-6-metoxy-1,4-benzoquinol methylase
MRIALEKTMTSDDVLERQLPIAAVRHNKGNCWVLTLPGELGVGDDVDHQARSALELLEDGRRLGPDHADHNRIRVYGRGLYSHWGRELYFSASDNTSPGSNGRRYSVRVPRSAVVAADTPIAAVEQVGEPPLFPRLTALERELRQVAPSLDLLHDPAGGEVQERLRLLEAKVEYLLDELYEVKSKVRHLTPGAPALQRLQRYQLETFDFQWKRLPYHDAFLTNPAWRATAADDVSARLGRPKDWFAGKTILDCGCGPGRHSWTFGTLGARVTAFDMSDNGLASARQECKDLPNVTFEKRNILEPLPYSTDFDVVWSYGVVHCTGDTMRALDNIARHVRPGGLIYIMVYPEPERTNGNSYQYYHEVSVIRRLVQHMTFEQKAELLTKVQGERWALSWFDAISSELNDLYTFEELAQMLKALGFVDVVRTMPHEHSMNVVATKTG